MLQGLYNTEIAESRAVGYCKKHRCYVTSTQIKRKECLNKQCYYLKKRQHEYWKQRELIKEKRRNRKEKLLCR